MDVANKAQLTISSNENKVGDWFSDDNIQLQILQAVKRDATTIVAFMK